MKNEQEDYYKVVKIFRKSGRKVLIEKNLSKEAAMKLVKSFPDSLNHMVCFFKQGGQSS